MDTINVKELKLNFPKTWEALNTDRFRGHIRSKSVVNIRKFLERNGYSICCDILLDSEKWLPTIVFHGREVGSDRYFYMNDFNPVSLTKAQKIGLMYALRDFEQNRD